MPPSYVVLLVFSTSQALRVEKLLSKGGVPCRLVPVPPNLTSDSGVCIRINAIDRDLARTILRANGVSVGAFHDLA